MLIISSNEKAVGVLSELLKAENCRVIEASCDAAHAREMLNRRNYDILLIDSPLPDEDGLSLAADAASTTASGILLLADKEKEKEAEEKLLTFGVLVLGRPPGRQLFIKALHLLDATRYRISGIRSENDRLQRKMDDNRIINRAKAILMEYVSMTEPQAHKYLERQAMDLRLTKVEVAKRLLSTYEN